jgi:hypothetical protein
MRKSIQRRDAPGNERAAQRAVMYEVIVDIPKDVPTQELTQFLHDSPSPRWKLRYDEQSKQCRVSTLCLNEHIDE